MVDSLGAVNYSQKDGYMKTYSERTGLMIDQEVKNIINSQYAACKALLEEKKEKIEE